MDAANLRKTKIVATIGPACDAPELIEQLILAGVNVARLNFSHGTHAEHAARIALLRATAERHNRPLAILQDLQGPKIRTGPLWERHPVELVAGSAFTITTRTLVGDRHAVSTTYQALPTDVRPGDRILISDGLIELRVIETDATDVRTEVVFGGSLRESQGINLPGVAVSAPALTAKDREDLQFGLEHDVDYVALSFVRRATDLQEIQQVIAAAGRSTPVIAKIEKPEALDDLGAILRECQGIMVARGDLGVEIAPEQVPVVQKQLITAANDAGIPVITATQMLDSMIRHPRPTRAEVSDVANAIMDGSDAVMLSGETASGQHPIAAVAMMGRIIEVTEHDARRDTRDVAARWKIPHQPGIDDAISAAANAIAETLPMRAIVAFTVSGRTARLLARLRPMVPIYAFTPSRQTYQCLSLVHGVVPILSTMVARLSDLSRHVATYLPAHNLARSGDLVAIIGGHPFTVRGVSNIVKILAIP